METKKMEKYVTMENQILPFGQRCTSDCCQTLYSLIIHSLKNKQNSYSTSRTVYLSPIFSSLGSFCEYE